jgi:DNA integrity scanning protein DisA with diadenylate cyclase activity
MGEKRSRKVEEEAKEARANEQIRRKAGKVGHTTFETWAPSSSTSVQETNKIKDDLKLKQALKEAEEKKRGTIVILPNRPAHLLYA